MCGRFYVDDEMARELEKICNQIDEKNRLEQLREKAAGNQSKVDIYPGTNALIIKEGKHANWSYWGYERSDKKLLINKRVETLGEKGSFFYDFQKRRCIIPARGFYEWNQNKEQYDFSFGKTYYMAGIYHQESKGETFTIITTNANQDVSQIHSRMPLLLEEKQAFLWLEEEQAARDLCKLILEPGKLQIRKMEHKNQNYQQLKLEF